MRGRKTTRRRPAFGARLAAIRSENGLTQSALAQKLGVDRSLIRYYERDTNDPKVSFVRRCSAILNVPLERLIGTARRSRLASDRAMARFVRDLEAMDSRKRDLALRLFSGQLTQIRRSN